MQTQDELPLDHEPSLNHWAKALADDDVATGEHTNWDAAYECAWDYLASLLDLVYIGGWTDANV